MDAKEKEDEWRYNKGNTCLKVSSFVRQKGCPNLANFEQIGNIGTAFQCIISEKNDEMTMPILIVARPQISTDHPIN
jgi:hypothetical protein